MCGCRPCFSLLSWFSRRKWSRNERWTVVVHAVEDCHNGSIEYTPFRLSHIAFDSIGFLFLYKERRYNWTFRFTSFGTLDSHQNQFFAKLVHRHVDRYTFINLKNISQEKLFTLREDTRPWRVYIRPFSMILLSLSLITTRRGFLTLTGTVLLIFLTVDVARLLANRHFPKSLHTRLYRESEKGKISSMSFFLLGIFISLRLFNKTVKGSLTDFVICCMLHIYLARSESLTFTLA